MVREARPDGRGEIAKAMDALEKAREMPRGPERNRALKNVGLLRYVADNFAASGMSEETEIGSAGTNEKRPPMEAAS